MGSYPVQYPKTPGRNRPCAAIEVNTKIQKENGIWTSAQANTVLSYTSLSPASFATANNKTYGRVKITNIVQ
tara:strand:- start:701 stop:916 length:216 start_codon:yes stop_codon:yes gene_type:complete